ncbi:MAG TPA: hypothetical protein VLR26_11635 [Frankiaceae bacterium]|nr:hypothetical protein [Frankiaceae bacterium]
MSESQPPIAPPGSNPPVEKPLAAAGGGSGRSGAGASPPGDAATGRSRLRNVLLVVLGLVVLGAIGVGLVLFLGRGDGTKQAANPLEVRRLVATFACTPDRPGTPENLRLTAGQEVVKVPNAGCAVVGEVVGRVDRLGKVKSATGKGTCTVTVDAPVEYGRIVDAAANVSDGQARALVAGGWLLDVRAVIDYPGRPSSPLHVVFAAPDPAACTQVSAALALQ